MTRNKLLGSEFSLASLRATYIVVVCGTCKNSSRQGIYTCFFNDRATRVTHTVHKSSAHIGPIRDTYASARARARGRERERWWTRLSSYIHSPLPYALIHSGGDDCRARFAMRRGTFVIAACACDELRRCRALGGARLSRSRLRLEF